MKRIMRTIVVLVTMLAGVSAGTAVSADSGGTDRPYHASGIMTGSITLAGEWSVTGPSVGTHTGAGVTWAYGSFVTGNFGFEVTAANGDVIGGVFVSPQAPVGNECPEGWSTFSDLDRITGGTGRFDGATGTLDVWGCTFIDFGTGAFTIAFTASGTISY